MKKYPPKSTAHRGNMLAYLLIAFICTLSITCRVEARGSAAQKNGGSNITPDSCAIRQLTDSVCQIVFNAKTACIYKLAPTVEPSDGDKTIGGFPVEKTIGKTRKEDIAILQFLLSDGKQFADNSFGVSMPYLPSFAIEFTQKKEKVSLLIAIASGEMAIVKNGKRIKYVQTRQPRLFALLLRKMTCDPIFDEYLKTK